MIMQSFTPAQSGRGFTLSPILEPLAPFRTELTVISGLAHYQASALGDGPGGHGRACPAFLTGTHARRTEGSDLRAGISIDQIVLSDVTYGTSSPGALKNDTQILAENDGSGTPPPPPPPPPPPGDDEIVLYAARNPVLGAGWRAETDATAADGSKLRHPNAGAAKLGAPSANPVNYFELTFDAKAGRPYRLWMRGKADSNNWANDSVFVQFDRSVDSNSASMWRIGTASAAE